MMMKPAASAASFNKVLLDTITPTMIENTKNRRNRRNCNKTITITYINEIQPGKLERTLANIYAGKVKNGTLTV